MLPLYEKTCAKLDEMLHKRILSVINENLGIVKEVKKLIQHEGDRSFLFRGDGTHDETQMKTSDASLSIGEAEASDMSLHELLTKWDSIGHEMARSIKKNFFLSIDETLKKYDRVTQINDVPQVNDFLSMFRDLQIDFNSDGTPRLPQLVCGKEFYEKIKVLNEDPKNIAIFQSGLAEIIEQKRKEWNARENARKLAD